MDSKSSKVDKKKFTKLRFDDMLGLEGGISFGRGDKLSIDVVCFGVVFTISVLGQ